uniref:Uncharacterized protein n=1 Tax=Arundo donax TaxID=35708 RepID=A0A0A9CP39_ARUDO
MYLPQKVDKFLECACAAAFLSTKKNNNISNIQLVIRKKSYYAHSIVLITELKQHKSKVVPVVCLTFSIQIFPMTVQVHFLVWDGLWRQFE